MSSVTQQRLITNARLGPILTAVATKRSALCFRIVPVAARLTTTAVLRHDVLRIRKLASATRLGRVMGIMYVYIAIRYHDK